jgi:hypothetical protein
MHDVPGESGQGIHDLDADANAGVTQGRQKELGAVVVSTKGVRTAVGRPRILLVQEQR